MQWLLNFKGINNNEPFMFNSFSTLGQDLKICLSLAFLKIFTW